MLSKITIFNTISFHIKAMLFCLILCCFSVQSQNSTQENPIESSFNEYAKTPREIAFAHLNKSVYIKGETVAFKVYIFDKYDKGLSKLTTNLYWNITDSKGNVIKKEMLLVENGVAHGNFFVDDLLTSGNYIFKAYTNWMKNFSEQNYYSQNIKVIDPGVESTITPKIISSTLDAQFLPEGGHLVANTENTVGVVVKDSLGFGVPFVEYSVYNEKNEMLSTSKTNAYGIGKFAFIPRANENVYVTLNFEGGSQTFNLQRAETNGITMSLKDFNNRIALRFGTNETTLPHIKNKPYTLAIHNGVNISTTKIKFDSALEVVAVIGYDELSPGINIFTLFDEHNIPLLERLFFKFEGIEAIKTGQLVRQQEGDSLIISIPLNGAKQENTNNFSVSILPTETKSYHQHQNIFSSVYLQPYIKGQIEDANYYFTNIDRQKKFELDNLLLTQGWSSYVWNTIFNYPPQLNYDFETGIRFTANINKTNSGRFMMYPLTYNDAETFETQSNNIFEKAALFPLENEKLRMGEINKDQTIRKASLYVQFTPSSIPEISANNISLPLKEKTYYSSNARFPILESSWREIEELDEVVLNVKKSEMRIEKLQSSPFEKVDILDDMERFAYTDFASYIRSKGFLVNQEQGQFIIKNNSVIASGFFQDEGDNSPSLDPNGLPSRPDAQGVPAIYLNDVLLTDHTWLYSFDMGQVDYIAINKRGFGQGLKGGAGVIKIYTNPELGYRSNLASDIYQEIEIPLTFANPKKFYAPKYQSYSNQFYKDYGVVDWIPNIKVDEKGNLSFKISDNQQTNINFYIEGTSDNGKFLSDIKTLQL